MRLSSPIYKLKRQAKLMAREHDVKLHVVLDQLARKEGFNDWSHLAATYAKTTPAQKVIAQLRSGDLVLLAARPGQGKTLLGLELAALAKTEGRTGYVFSLDYTTQDIWDRYARLGFDPKTLGDSVILDTSDQICADHIIDRLRPASRQSLVVIDFLQLLDQRRSHPPLQEQVEALKAFAQAHGSIVVAISQIDRAFDPAVNRLPSLEDVRLPNPIDLSLFEARCFLHDSKIRVERAA